MAYSAPAPWLLEALAPLGSTYGERLRFAYDGEVAQWSYEGQAAVVELGGADRILAHFMAPPAIDAVSGRTVTPVYLREEHGYALTRAGCQRMVEDMKAFFAGTREPRFRFVATR